jgi:hypothetical protein
MFRLGPKFIRNSQNSTYIRIITNRSRLCTLKFVEEVPNGASQSSSTVNERLKDIN